MTKSELSKIIKTKALALSFDACTIAEAEYLSECSEPYSEWLQKKYNGDIHYLENNFDKRLNPQLLVENTKTVVSLAYNYYSPYKQHESAPIISKYAYGIDYHVVIRNKLNIILDFLKTEFGIGGRAFTDSAPICEKTWAVKSGLGSIGKNTNIIIKGKGSFFFLAELLLDIEVEPDLPSKDICGNCAKCIDACPTNAIIAPYKLDATKCISYLTIEYKGGFNEKDKLYNRVFGCDICQDVCPWNRFSKDNSEALFRPKQRLLEMTKDDWFNLSEDEFNELFNKSAIKRSKYSGLIRNINAIKAEEF